MITVGVFDRGIHPHPGIAGGALEIDRAGRLVRFCAGHIDNHDALLVNAGLSLMEPGLVGEIPSGAFYDFGFHDLFPRRFAREMPIHTHLLDGYCLGLDTPQAYRRALELVEKGGIKLS